MSMSELPSPSSLREKPSSEGFHVVAKNGGELHKWIKFYQAAFEYEFLEQGSNPPSLTLGEYELNNGGPIKGINSGIIFKNEHGVSDLSTTLILDRPEQGGFLSMIQGSNMLITSDQSPTEKVPLDKLAAFLVRNLDNTPYKALYDANEGTIRLVLDDTGDDVKGVTIRKVPHPQVQALYVETDISNDVDVVGFDERYQEYARLLEEVVRGIYQASSSPIPTKTYELNPPKGLSASLEKQQRRIDLVKKNMANQGLIEDDGIIKEIIGRVRLERRPDVTFDDIAGLEVAKDELQTVKAALEDPQSFYDEGVTPPRGVLLYGPPGTGKTLLAKALAHEADAVLYNVNVSDVVHHLYGKTERLIQAIFDAAAQEAKPVIIFFDELDALAASRDRSTEVTSRIVSVLLTNLDGLEDKPGNLVVIGATNRREVIDPALLRPGRFTFEIPTSNPNDAARKQVYDIHMRRAVELSGGKDLFEPEFDIDAVVHATPKEYSPDDIREIIRRTLAKRVKAKNKGEVPSPTTTQDLLDTIRLYGEVKKGKESTGQYL